MRRWKVDANARQDANLLLSSVSLPGGVQRRKNEADELQMRQFFAEGDVLVVRICFWYTKLVTCSKIQYLRLKFKHYMVTVLWVFIPVDSSFAS
jgi:exosome complex RNA-binding protein Rrp4